MLYSVIPPILLVLSVIGIIIFFVKKAPEAERLSELSKEAGESGAGGRPAETGKLKAVWLALLETVVGMLRKLFSSLDKSVIRMAGSIKEKRAGRSEKKAKEAQRREDYLIEKLNGYGEDRPEPAAPSVSDVTKQQVQPQSPAKPKALPTEKEKPVRPMLSDRVAVPDAEERRKKEEKIRERLENVLIERIAMNPRDTEAYERLGEYYFDLENYEHAKECFKQVIKLDPTNRSVKYKMKKLETLLSR